VIKGQRLSLTKVESNNDAKFNQAFYVLFFFHPATDLHQHPKDGFTFQVKIKEFPHLAHPHNKRHV
jgi:hypothetical protein